ncbi:MAG: hypothetical protein H5U40_07165, partial [Polyangiaceae bacterium]|nr:hypothetical protein [Polyangiaceae bacterium]
PPAAAPAPVIGEGTTGAPYRLREIPYARRLPAGALGSSLSGYAGCGEHEGAAPEAVFRVRVEAPTRLWASAYGFGAIAPRIFLLGEEPRPDACLATAEGDSVLALEAPGVYHIVVEAEPRRLSRDEAAPENPGMLFVLTAEGSAR